MILNRMQLRTQSGIVNLNESQLRTRYYSVYDAAVKVFLSHKHQDLDELYAVKRILEKCGAEPYVDWLDKSMPEETNADTAANLKDRIDDCDKFIFIATIDSLKAPWCNWEIGYGDAAKFASQSIAIFPIKEDNGTWEDNEYLRLYPSIEYEDGTTKYTSGRFIPKGYYVEMPVVEEGYRSIIPLNEWLYKNKEIKRLL